jgi:hypothetical protein
LDIGFSTKLLRSLSESETLASRKLGPAAAAALHTHLADIMAARNVAELPLGFVISGHAPSRFSLPLADGLVAVFESNHVQDRERGSDFEVKWHRVSRIKFLEIGSVHD